MPLIKANVETCHRKFNVMGTMICAWMIIYITVLIRYPSLSNSTRLTPFWSYAEVLSGNRSPSGILLNIALFIPLGWFLAAVMKRGIKRWYVIYILPIIFSILIELIQYKTGRGTADIDDVISNGLGGAIGIVLFHLFKKRSRMGHGLIVTLSVIMIAANGIGAYMSAGSVLLISSLREYDFVIDKVSWEGDEVTISGSCSVYDGVTPSFQLILRDGSNHVLDTVIDGDHFTASGMAGTNRKNEILIHFSGHETMSTGTWISGTDVGFVAGELPQVEAIPEGLLLKAYDRATDTLVYQNGDRLLWLIGADIDSTTEVIYHLYTNELDNLPENRKRYGFDNRGFRVGTESAHELDPLNNYRVFETVIPSEYHVTEIVVGFNTNSKITWEQNFRVDY